MAPQPRILIVIADQKERSALADALQNAGYQVLAAADYQRGYERLMSSQFDLIATEAEPAAAGIDFITRVRATPQLAGILMLAIAEWGAGAATLALAHGANGYEPKPVDATRILASVNRLLSLKTVEVE